MQKYATRFHILFRLSDYRWLWLITLATSLGSWTFTFVSTWQMYSFTHAASWVGVMILVTTMPGILVNGVFASFVERIRRKRLLAMPSGTIVLLSILLFVLSVLQRSSPMVLVLTGLLFGLASGVLNLTLSIAVPSVVTRDLLLSALALLALAQKGTEMLGPAISSPLQSQFGFGLAYLFLGLPYVGVFLFIARLQDESGEKYTSKEVGKDRVTKVPKIDHSIRATVLLAGLHCGLTMSFVSVLSTFLVQSLHSGSLYGSFLSVIGFGSLLAAMILIELRSPKHRQILMWLSSLTSGLSLVLLGASYNTKLAFLSVALTGLTQTAFMTLSLALVQEHAGERLRARSTALYLLVSSLSASIGNWGLGLFSHFLSPRSLFSLSGETFIFVTLLFWMNWTKSRRSRTDRCVTCILHEAVQVK